MVKTKKINYPKPPTTGKEYADYLMRKFAHVPPVIPVTWKKVHFAHFPTYVTPEADIYTHTEEFPLKKIAVTISEGYNQVSIRWKNRKKTRGISQARLFFFCFIYPDILNKKLEDLTLTHLRQMPFLTFKDNNPKNVHPNNLVFQSAESDRIYALYCQTRPEFRKYFRLSPKLKARSEKKK